MKRLRQIHSCRRALLKSFCFIRHRSSLMCERKDNQSNVSFFTHANVSTNTNNAKITSSHIVNPPLPISIRVLPEVKFSETTRDDNFSKFLATATASLIVVFCIERKDDFKEQGFFRAVKYGRIAEVKRWLKEEKYDPNHLHILGWTALHVAAMNCRLEITKMLLQAGADPNIPDQFSTVNEKAMEKGMSSAEVAFRREDQFSDRLNSRSNFRGFTPLHYAVLTDNVAVISELLNAGANPTLRNELGYSAVKYAHTEGVRDLLGKYASKFVAEIRKKDLEERRRFPLEKRLKQKIVGQEGAITTVASAIRRKENGWSDDDHPLVFLFLGSSGIGKTELAKQLATYIHRNKPYSFIRLDMSEYQEKHEVAKLIGAPPGYIGHDDGGQLTKMLKKCPTAVVLFDEVDKAHPDVLTVLLQLFDEGRLTDGQGKTIECKDAVFVMTSNLASSEIAEHALSLRHEAEDLVKQKMEGKLEQKEISETIAISRTFKENVVQPILKQHFKRDEFLGRINEIVYFLPFSRSELYQLVRLELKFWATKAREKHLIELQWDTDVEGVLANGYDIHYGARSIKHEVERRVINQLAAAHERGDIGNGCVVNLVAAWDDPENPVIKIQVKPNGAKGFTEVNQVKSSLLNFNVNF